MLIHLFHWIRKTLAKVRSGEWALNSDVCNALLGL